MKKIILGWLGGVLAVMATISIAKLLGLELYWDEQWKIILFIPILGLVNAFIGTLLRIFAAPITCMTLGLFGLVVNGVVFYTAGVLTDANMDLPAAIFGAICMSLISGLINLILGINKED
jgi:putative membrane protein